MNYNWKKHFAIKSRFEKDFAWIPETPGIYLWTRYDETINKTYYYIGQAKNLKNRRFDYYKIQTGLAYPTRHFEASLKKHKDWKYQILQQCELDQLDQLEKDYIASYMAKDNYITRNDSLTGNDTTKSNFHRIERIQKKFDKKLVKLLKHLIIELKENQTIISPELKKNGEPTKLAQDSFNGFNEMIKGAKEQKVDENENNSNIINNENKEAE